MNPKTTDLGENLLPHDADAAPPPANEPIIHLPASRAEVEAAQVEPRDASASLDAEEQSDRAMATGSPLTAGDPDAIAERAEAVGEEAVGGTTPTPEQNDVDAIAAAAGINTQPEHPVGVLNEMNRRDDQRFELDPESKDSES
ncbi:DUF6335 family protein [Leptolyngbya sp. CCNP1308]|uniref:DUF6335 family protein n=1 Tax=Leptolyngbya sp. CCNP1308 TaxID=3110255 RepID=UPI002B1F6E39|nr:DUF6335 family protein [Leptolyngbya sp. CCNP1308]MEA5452480.1 DUF6335 family protein [Leptolyngbya sp. CCNP1308]